MDAKAPAQKVRSAWLWLWLRCVPLWLRRNVGLWLRPAAVGCLTVVTAFLGLWLLPSQPSTGTIVRPEITVYADQPGVTFSAGLALYSGKKVPTILEPASIPPLTTCPPSGPHFTPAYPRQPMTVGYVLGITLRILSPVTRPVKVVVVMQYFPPLTGFGVVVPLSWVRLPPPLAAISVSALAPPQPAPADLVGLRSYLAVDTLCPLPHHVVPANTKALAETVGLPLMSLHSLGSVSGGSKLRIVFPLIGNQVPQAAAGLSSFPLPIGELSRAIKSPPPLPQQLYQPDIAPAFTEYVGAGEDLSNFEALSGDPPALTPAENLVLERRQRRHATGPRPRGG